MPKFEVEVPVIIFVRYRVEADNAEDARGVEVMLSELFYIDATGGISLERDAVSVGAITNDTADWDRVEVFAVEGEE